MGEEKRIKVLASDIGGVIAYFKHGEPSGTLKDFAVMLEYHTGVSADVWQKFLEIAPGTPEQGFILGQLTPKQFFWELRRIARVCRKSFIDFDLMKKMWCNIFYPNVELLTRLRDLSSVYKVVFASNIDVWHYNLIMDLCRIKFVDEESGVVSYLDHVIKPDPAFFRLLIKKCGAEPGEIFFFDDRPENCESARRCGIEVHQFVDNKSFFEELEKKNIVKYLGEKGETR